MLIYIPNILIFIDMIILTFADEKIAWFIYPFIYW